MPPEAVAEANFTVAVSFRHNAKPCEYRCDHLDLRVGDGCVVDTERGPDIGVVMRARMKIPGRKFCHKVNNVIRKATAKDLETDKRRMEREVDIYRLARQKVDDYELKMKVSHVEITFDEKRAILYYTSDRRVDFRDMVKDISSEVNLKMEMRQMGSRDEARLLGGCGICGNKLCCSSFISDFAPVSIKMAKDQGLSLNPTKISGACGRLMCCLVFENAYYKEMQKYVPKVGKAVRTPQGQGRVIVADYLRLRVTVDIPGEGIVTLEASEVELVNPPRPQGKPGGRQGKPQKGKRRDGGNRHDRGRDRPRPEQGQEARDQKPQDKDTKPAPPPSPPSPPSEKGGSG